MNNSYREVFVLTDQHILLLQHANVGWQDCEYGAPEIDPKRPYGNGDVEGDVIKILGIPGVLDADGCLDSELAEMASKLHGETQVALQIILSCKTFEPGTYAMADYRKWIRLPEADAKPLEPADKYRCQTEIIPPYSLFQFGPRGKPARCNKRPVCIATEKTEDSFGRRGQMSLCTQHLLEFLRQNPDIATFVPLDEKQCDVK